VDQATIIAYAAGYIAAMFGIILLYLPLLASVGLLLLLAGAVNLVAVLLKAVTLGLYRALVRLFRALTRSLHHGADGRELLPR
jgi:hypothetical protein